MGYSAERDFSSYYSGHCTANCAQMKIKKIKQTGTLISSIEEGPEPEEDESDTTVFNTRQTAIYKSPHHQEQSQRAQSKVTPCGWSNLPPLLNSKMISTDVSSFSQLLERADWESTGMTAPHSGEKEKGGV